MEIQVISSETIKPSIPTPSHLRNFSFSLIDQTFHQIYVPIILFYPNPSRDDGSNMNISSRLKVSFSEALTRFYPLAGRIKDINSLSIDCNDEGALFTEAKVSCDMSEFLKQPKLELLKNFVPIISGVNVEDIKAMPANGVLIAIQLNVFTCGGIALTSMASHKFVDVVTIASFLKFWAAAAANYPTKIPLSIIQPNDIDDLGIASKLFPPRESIPDDLLMTGLSAPIFKLGNGIWRRFVFDDEAISTLKSRLFPTLGSRFFLITSLLLKHAMVAVDAAAARAANSSSSSTLLKKQSILNFKVNMRSRMIPPLSQYSMGNLIYPVHVLVDHNSTTDKQQLQRLVDSQKEELAKINDEYLASIQGEEGFAKLYSDFKERRRILSSNIDEVYGSTSWCNLGLNELDYGWGKPIWVSRVVHDTPGKYLNLFFLMDTVDGRGIEAWIMLSEAAMDILERDQEFLSFATLNPGIVVPSEKKLD